MKIKYNLLDVSSKNFFFKLKKLSFFKKKYENLNFLILKKKTKNKNYDIYLKKNNFLVYDDSINIDNNSFTKEKNLNEILKFKSYGFKKKFLLFFEKRVEVLKSYPFNIYDDLSWNNFINFNKNLINFKLSHITFINISIMFFNKSYKGFRHLFNLPCNGQRTWSNGKTLNKKKNVLIESMYNVFKDGLPNAHPTEIKSSFQLEKYNLLWINQWKPEWMLGNKRIQADLKKTNKTYKFESNSLVRINPNFVKIKKKQVAPLGFEPGFTKFYLKEMKKYLKQQPRKTPS